MSTSVNRIKYICRLCLMITERSKRYELFLKSELESHDPTDNHREVMETSGNEMAQQDDFSQMFLYEKVEFCCGIRLAPKSELPSKICGKCFYQIHTWYNFRQMSYNSQIMLASRTNIKLDDNSMARNATELQSMRGQLLSEKRQEDETEIIIPDLIKEDDCKNIEKLEIVKKSPNTTTSNQNEENIMENSEEEESNNADDEEENEYCQSNKEDQDCITEICIEKLLPENPLDNEAAEVNESNNSLRENLITEKDTTQSHSLPENTINPNISDIVSDVHDDGDNLMENHLCDKKNIDKKCDERSIDKIEQFKIKRRIPSTDTNSTSDSNETTDNNEQLKKNNIHSKKSLTTINTKRKLLKKQEILKREIRKQQYIKKKLQAKLKAAELEKSIERKEFDCSLCNKKFEDYDVFKKHLDACGNSFVPISYRKRRTNEEIIGERFKCKYCPLHYKDEKTRQRHQKIHTDTPKYKCPVCNKRFMFKDNVKKHMRSHTGQRDYSCGVCNISFILPHHLKNHIKTWSHQEKQKSYEALGFKIVFETTDVSES